MRIPNGLTNHSPKKTKVRVLDRREIDAVSGGAPGGNNPFYGGPTDWNTNHSSGPGHKN
jgi:hypothetical protein